MKWFNFIVAVSAILMLVGCGKQLTRPEAAEILNNSNFGITKTYSLNMAAIESNQSSYAELLALRNNGFIILSPPTEYMNFNVSGEVLKDHADIKMNSDSMIVVIAKCNHFVVDGIEKVSDTECIVQARRDLTVTDAGQTLGFREDKGAIVGYTFRLFDDGWRVMGHETMPGIMEN